MAPTWCSAWRYILCLCIALKVQKHTCVMGINSIWGDKRWGYDRVSIYLRKGHYSPPPLGPSTL